jgi:hypothetical protein
MKQHKWHKEIKAWADGADIEVRHTTYYPEGYVWITEEIPKWDSGNQYRIKPQLKEPQYLYVYEDSFYGVDEKDIRAGTRIMNKRVKEFEETYIGKIKLEVDDEAH